MERKVLGKGLEALIPRKESTQVKEPVPVQQREYTFIDINKLRPSEYQSRTTVKEEDLRELADSIKSKGVIQPLIVRKKDLSRILLLVGPHGDLIKESSL